MTTEKSKPPLQFFTEADSPTGVDDFLLLEQLRLTPEERLQWLDRAVANMNRLRRAANILAHNTDD